MIPTKVALAGATGNLGIVVLETLLRAELSVTVLTRIGGNSAKLEKYRNVVVREVDFSNIDSIKPALEGITVVVSCLATLAIGSQNALIDAACATGVRRFIPAEFGMDSLNELCRELPVCQPKAATQHYLEDKWRKNPSFTWTGIANGLFLDWGLRVGFIINLQKHQATLFDGGDVPFSATNLEDVAKAVLGIIKNQDATANRLIYIHSAVTTQNQLLRFANDMDGKKWSSSTQETRVIMQDSLQKLSEGKDQEAMDGFCVVAMFDPRYGGDFSAHLDNDLVGLRELDEAGVREVVARVLSEASKGD